VLAADISVGYRSQNPSNATVSRVMKELQENDIDVSQLVPYRTDICNRQNGQQQVNASGKGNVTLLSAILNIVIN
jgi:hypothetical protein